MKYLFYGTVCLVIIFIILNVFNYDGFYLMINFFEWATRYILPWIAVYWFIEYVKRTKRKRPD